MRYVVFSLMKIPPFTLTVDSVTEPVVKIIISTAFYSTSMMASFLASGSEDEDDDKVTKVTNGQEAFFCLCGAARLRLQKNWAAQAAATRS